MGPQPKDVKGFFILIKSLLLVMLLLGTSASLVFAEELVKKEAKESLHEIRVVELKHRSASQILEAIKPHLAPNTAASEQNQNLIISGEAAKLEQLELLINALDEPVQAWRVIFSQGQVNHQQVQQTSGRHYSTARSDVFELLVREGAAARLERGFWIPVETGVGQYRTKAYEWLSSGIWVTVKPVGDQLILNLSTQEAKQERTSSLQTPRFSGRQLEGEFSLQVGRWVTLGSEAQLAAQIPDVSRRYTGGSRNEYYSICIEASNKKACAR